MYLYMHKTFFFLTAIYREDNKVTSPTIFFCAMENSLQEQYKVLNAYADHF